ncbi:hypothetical protein H0R92_09440 [Treponema sp. OMZ 840]|uniref:hypothetical protein n=1 Tax=Treponema sp. OMZ 840 TaxID=244313 RepID=UPI003D8D217B
MPFQFWFGKHPYQYLRRKLFHVLQHAVHLAGTIGTGGNEKPCYWKGNTKYELPMDSEMAEGYACSLTLKDGKAYSAGDYGETGVSTAIVWEGNTPYWQSPERWTAAHAILTEGSSLYIAGKLKKDEVWEASVADITDKTQVRIAHLHTSTGTEEGSRAYGLCASPSAFYAVGQIYNSVVDQKKGALWTISKTFDGTVTETVLATGEDVWPKAVCFLDGAAYAAGRNAARNAAVWKVTGTGTSATITETELETDGSEANAACTKDGFVFIGGRNRGKPCIWKGTDSSFTAIPLSSKDGTVNALYAFGNDIYAAGYIQESGVKKAAYWKFTSAISSASDADITVLPDADSEAYGIAVAWE